MVFLLPDSQQTAEGSAPLARKPHRSFQRLPHRGAQWVSLAERGALYSLTQVDTVVRYEKRKGGTEDAGEENDTKCLNS